MDNQSLDKKCLDTDITNNLQQECSSIGSLYSNINKSIKNLQQQECSPIGLTPIGSLLEKYVSSKITEMNLDKIELVRDEESAIRIINVSKELFKLYDPEDLLLLMYKYDKTENTEWMTEFTELYYNVITSDCLIEEFGEYEKIMNEMILLFNSGGILFPNIIYFVRMTLVYIIQTCIENDWRGCFINIDSQENADKKKMLNLFVKSVSFTTMRLMTRSMCSWVANDIAKMPKWGLIEGDVQDGEVDGELQKKFLEFLEEKEIISFTE